MVNIPIHILEEILSLVKDKFPNKLPDDTIVNCDLSRLIGQQDVVKYLDGLLSYTKDRDAIKSTNKR